MVEIEEISKPKSSNMSSKPKLSTIPTTTRTQDSVDQFNGMMKEMSQARQELVDDDDYNAESPLSQAIEMALAQGRGWGPGEKQAYLERILADNFIPPLFASSAQEVEESGLQEAFTSLIYDGENAETLMVQFKDKGNKSFADGKRNKVKNMQYFRDAVNRYYEALAWSQEAKPVDPIDGTADEKKISEDSDGYPQYTTAQLHAFQASLYNNIALSHMQLQNWGFCRDFAKKAIALEPMNIKAHYRLAKALTQLQDWEAAGEIMDKEGVDCPEMQRLHAQTAKTIQKARRLRQQRERARAERVARVKTVFRHCQTESILLGRVPLVTGEDEDEDENHAWQHHLPHSGLLPSDGTEGWSWPCLFVYPSHNQSDLITSFGEREMIAERMAEVFPELEDSGEATTSMPWDHDNQFTCSQLAVYFEVHEAALKRSDKTKAKLNPLVHPDDIQVLPDQASCMRFYEASRALKGDEGQDIYNVVRLVELQQRSRQQTAWKKEHGSLWANRPSSRPVVRVHPAMKLHDVLTDNRMIVPNFLVTVFFIPENHPAHDAFLKEHKCLGVLQPEQS